MPNVAVGAPGTPPQILSGAGTPLDDDNGVLDRRGLVSAQATFLTTHEEATTAQATARAQGIDAPHLGHFITLHFPSDADVRAIARELSQLSEVEQAVPISTSAPPAGGASAGVAAVPAEDPPKQSLVGDTDKLVVLDPSTGLENQWYIFRCRVNSAWASSTGKGVVIADIDYGCQTAHQSLAANIQKKFNAVDGTQGNQFWHGTGVLGLTGAAINGKGIAGIAYEATLWVVQANTGDPDAWARAIDWVRSTDSGGKHKVVILQNSAYPRAGNIEQWPSVNAAIKTAIGAGVVVCVAAGNGASDAGLDDAGHPFPETGSILVGATVYDSTYNIRAGNSNYGPRVVVCAPGDTNHDLTCRSTPDSPYTNSFGGTSGAAPKVAGVAALMLAANPNLTHAQVRSILSATGSAVIADPGKAIGTFLNAQAALQQAMLGTFGRIEVFVRGSDGVVYHNWQITRDNEWSGWASLGGWVDIIKSARNADGRLEVFVRGSDKAIYHIWQTESKLGWSNWASLGSSVDLFEVAQNADGRLEVFARGSDGAAYHNWQTTPGNGWSGWVSLGAWIDMIDVRQNLA